MENVLKKYVSEVQNHFSNSLKKNGKREIFCKKTGNVKLIKHYSKNLLNGKYIYYWDNGQVRFKGSFKANKRLGIWKNYDTNGVLILEEDFK